jgi:5'-nucleotidase
MKILLTNDDGYGAEGLMELEAALALEHEVTIIAPMTNRSGCSQALTLGQNLRLQRHSPTHFAASGNPTDCVILAKSLDFFPQFDLVVSGINHGPNIGTDVMYSGTAAGARQAIYMGIPGIALSYASYEVKGNFTTIAQSFSKKLGAFLHQLSPEAFLNINFPQGFSGSEEWLESTLAPRRYADWAKVQEAGHDLWEVTLEGDPSPSVPPTGSDWDLLEQGKVAYSWVYGEPLTLSEVHRKRGDD